MGQEIIPRQQRPADLGIDTEKWMPLSASWALADAKFTSERWDATVAKRALIDAKIDPPALLRAANERLRPVPQEWLAGRLTRLWESMPTSGNMTFKAWLHETGRMLKHLPHDILTRAIDGTIEAGHAFVPGAAQILEVAEPLHQERKRQRDRLDVIVNGAAARVHRPWEEDRCPFPSAGVCTPDEAAEIMREHGLVSAEPATRVDRGPPRQLTYEDYIELGVPAAVARAALDARGAKR